MARTRATAVSAMVLALALTGVGTAPFIMQSASASVAYDPGVEPCEAGQACENSPEVTVTVTTTLGTPTPEEPETTITRTVTKSPSKAPTPKKTTSSPAQNLPETTQPQNPQPFPTQSVQVPAPSSEPTEEETVEMPAVAGTETPTETLSSAAPEITTSEPVQLEVRNAAPEFDQRDVTQKLSIPALILVLLALFAVLIFEGRLRRLAHAAAVRRAGPYTGAPTEATGHPAGPGYPAGPGFPGGPGYPPAGYPAGPGYASVGYPAPPGYAPYAPIISFVPVHTAGGPVQYGAVYQDPTMYAPEAQSEPVVLHPDEYTSQEASAQEGYRSAFEPLVPVEEPPADIPAGGAEPYDDSPERPLGAASAAETGDSEPWQQTVREARPAEAGPGASQPVADDVTAVQPLPQQEERGRGWRRRRSK